MYESFARVYDLLMDDVDYGAWAQLYLQILMRRGLTGGTLCECACGTGSLTLRLAQAGWQVTGVDLSTEMLQIARAKMQAAGVPVRLICQDMCALSLPQQVDALLATCDGVNYLTDSRRLSAFCRSAYAALRPGGCLAFDVSTPWKLTERLGDQILAEDRETVTYVWQNRYHPRQHCVDLDLILFVRGADGRYDRMEEHQRQRAWERDELTEHLSCAGFSDIEVWGARQMAPPRSREERWHFSCVKPAVSE